MAPAEVGKAVDVLLVVVGERSAGRIERNLERVRDQLTSRFTTSFAEGRYCSLPKVNSPRVVVEVDRVAGQGVEDHGLAAHVAFLPSSRHEPAPLADVLAGVDGLAVAPNEPP